MVPCMQQGGGVRGRVDRQPPGCSRVKEGRGGSEGKD